MNMVVACLKKVLFLLQLPTYIVVNHKGLEKVMHLIRSLVVLLLLAVPATAKGIPQSQGQIQLSYAPLVKEVAPAVVNIYTKKTVEQRVSPLFSNPFFKQFFGREFGPGFGAPRKRVQNSLGSGVILREEGIVVTNHHVIDGADEIRVVLADRREFNADLIVSDDRTDIAVLRMQTDGEELPVVELRNSDDVEVGDLVLAIGNPFGVGQTVTSGIVSALARTNVGVSDYQSFIQTDAPINPGNSGGALVTMDGKLLGINTAIFSKSGGSVGIGFAIPANMVRFVVDSALNEGKVVRPWLGAGGQSVTSDMALALGLDRPAGVLINELYENGPADRGGLRSGDVVLSINDYDVYDARTLQYRFASMEPGGIVKLEILRDGSPKQLDIELKSAPESPARDIRIVEGWTPLAGAKVANLSPALADELGVNTMQSGIVVLGVQRRTQAAANGLRRGDIITAVNGREISTYNDVNDAIKGGPNSREVWRLSVIRGDDQGVIDVNIRR